jgi:DNA-binding NarL/FixJ family response regulator
MNILMISANSLFVEAVSENLAPHLASRLHSSPPPEALQRIQEEQPDILLVDENIPPGMFKKILKQTQRLSKTRLILLSCTGNEFIVLDSYPATIDNIDDLVQAIQRKDVEKGE